MRTSNNWFTPLRVSDEDGREASSRNFGRLALSAIPLLLGFGGLVWVSFYLGARSAYRQTAQEARANIAVGVTAPLTSPIKITIRPQEFCAPVVYADLDGKVLRLLSKNTCSKELTGMSWYYQLVSPDGTVLHESWKTQRELGCSHPRFKGDSAECVIENVKIDTRTAEARVWTVPYSDK